MPLSLQAPLLFGLASALIASLGLLAVALRRDWTARQSGLIALGAGGMLVTLCLVHIVPEALSLSANGGRFLLAGFLGGLVMSFVVAALFPENMAGGPAAAITPLLAIAIHSFLDGVLYSVAFAASFESGVYSALPLILHEFAEGIIAFAVLARHGVAVRPALFFAFLAAAATTPLGVMMSAPFMAGLGEGTIAILFAVSAGLLLYVATGPLMKPLQEEAPARAAGALTAGVLVGLLMLSLSLHGDGAHGHGHDHARNDPSGIHAGH